MILLAVIIQACSFYCWYNTSKRAVLLQDAISGWLQRHAYASATIGWLLLGLSFILLVNGQGFATGIFTAFLSLMTLGSLIILIVPLTTKDN